MISDFDLFISYKRDNGGDHGQRLAIELHEKLTKDGFKVWLDNEEIGFSNNFEQRIEEALLHSKKVACIIGPAWVESPNCRFEVQKAIEFEKRIIPIHYQEFRQLLASKKDEGILSEKEWLRIDRPQEIDFSIKKKYKSSYEDLKSVCNLHDEITLQFNKVLTESYYWEKYNYPKSMLLYGENLSKTKILRSKCNSDDELPSFTEPQDRFMSASDDYVKNEVTDKKKVYIAFTKEEIEYAAELNMELKLQGITTFYDDDFSADSENDSSFIQPILNCETIIDVEVSTFSDDNDLRLNFARSKNKRILKVTNSTSVKTRLESKGEKNIHVWNDQVSIDTLVTFINGDKVYNAFHAKLLGQSFDWEGSEKSNVKLLGSKEAKVSKDWYVQAERDGMEPQPSLSMINFVERSVAYAETLRKRKIGLFWTAALGAILIVVLGAVSWYFGDKANTQSILADEKTALANEKVKVAELQTKEAEIQRKKADEQKSKAEKQRKEAEKQREEAKKQKDFAASQQKKALAASNKAKESQKRAEEMSEKAQEAKELAEKADSLAKEKAEELEKSEEQLNLTAKKTEAAKLSLEAYDDVLDGKFTEAKQKADEAIKIYNEIEEDFETDILYNTYYSILKDKASVINNDFTKQDKSNAESIKLLHCSYAFENNFNWDLVEILGVSRKEVFSMSQSDNNDIGALGLKSGRIILFNTQSKKITDTVAVGKHRVTSMDFNDFGNQMVASTVNGKFTIIPLEVGIGKRNQSKQLIRRIAFARIEEIHYTDDSTIRAIGGVTVNGNNTTKTYQSYPATVSKIYEILK